MLNKRVIFPLIFVLIIISVLIFGDYQFEFHKLKDLALVTIHKVSSQFLRDKYQKNEIISVLIVPGHDNEFIGASYNSFRETDFNLELAAELFYLLKKDSRFRPIITRSIATGEYLPTLEDFLSKERGQKYLAQSGPQKAIPELGSGNKSLPTAQPLKPSEENAFRLYTINRWAELNNFDITIHIHFNDQYRKNLNRPGTYQGFSIFIPDQSSLHHQVSKDLAEAIHRSLSFSLKPSSAPGEARGIMESSELIALGANNSRYGAVFLVEYAYIYENILTNESLRPMVISEMARRTYLGLKDFFKDDFSAKYLPPWSYNYHWLEPITFGKNNDSKVFLLKHYLLYRENLYPPLNYNTKTCALDGNYDQCLRLGIKAFQEKYSEEILAPVNLKTGTGIFGSSTVTFLNKIAN